MKFNFKKIIIGIALLGGTSGAAIDAAVVSSTEFDRMIPTIAVKTRENVAYKAIVKDFSKYGLNQKETHFVNRILEGKGPTATGTATLEEIQQLYFSIAKKNGLTAQEILAGVNLFDYIRK